MSMKTTNLFIGTKENLIGFRLRFPDGREMIFTKFIGNNERNYPIEIEAMFYGLKNAATQKQLQYNGEINLKLILSEDFRKLFDKFVDSDMILKSLVHDLCQIEMIDKESSEEHEEMEKILLTSLENKDKKITELTPFHLLNVKYMGCKNVLEKAELKIEKNGTPRVFISPEKIYLGDISVADKYIWEQFIEEVEKSMGFLVDEVNGERVAIHPLHQKRYKFFQMFLNIEEFRRFVFEPRSRFLETFKVRPHILENISKSDYQLIHFGILYIRFIFLIEDTSKIIFVE